MTRADDLAKLREILATAATFEDEDDGRCDHKTRETFRGWLVRMERWPSAELSPRQRGWMLSVYERLTGTPQYRNDWSEGRVPHGREVATPAVLQQLPKRPPTRKSDP